jgi:hypothetical protein
MLHYTLTRHPDGIVGAAVNSEAALSAIKQIEPAAAKKTMMR